MLLQATTHNHALKARGNTSNEVERQLPAARSAWMFALDASHQDATIVLGTGNPGMAG